MNITEKMLLIAENMQKIFEAGKSQGGGIDTRLKELVEGTLTELVDDTITTVGGYSFYYSTVQKVDLQKCTSVGLYGFYTSTKLTSVNLPNCTTIGNFTFYGCEALARIDLGSVTSIGTKSFYNCKALKTLIIRTNQVARMTDTNYMLSNTPISSGKGYIYVPDDLVENYKVTAGWYTYKDHIKGLSELGGEN